MRVLVLEGGGMRGVYTSGVLEAFSEARRGRGLFFPHVVACSAGACAAASYLAGQPDRNRRVYLDYLDGGKLVRYSRLLTGGDVMDIDYLTDRVTLELCPLDLDALRKSESLLHIGVTDWATGEPRYLTNRDDDLLAAFRATCALPFFYRGEVVYENRRYVDGGVADPVPVAQALTLAPTEVVAVLTSPIEERGRRPARFGLERLFSLSPAVRAALEERYLKYRRAAALLREPPEGVRAHVVRPSRPLPVSRTTRDRARLAEGLDLGYADGRAFLEQAQLDV